MSTPGNNHKINYIEFVSTDMEQTKRFYTRVFGWGFTDWGPDYASFSAESGGIDGGFRRGDVRDTSLGDGPLVILYAIDLGATELAVIEAGGSIAVPTFEFPGGRRFHFSDGAGNVLAVWSE
jgi:predicted enzyme related to lactoylglutathione lyase